jgi:small GTP-binding protein
MISVIVIGKNEAARIGSCMKSIKDAMGVMLHEIIYVDSRSQDDSAVIARRWGARCYLLSDENTTAGLGRLIGTKEAQGEYLLFLDADMQLKKGFLEKAMMTMAAESYDGATGIRDDIYMKDGEKYILIDTACIRRKSKVHEDIERYSVIRAVAAIERCDVCVLMIDAEEGLTDQDKKIAGVAHEAGKGIVVAVNKWDLIQKETNTMRDYKRGLEAELQFMSYAPIIFISVQDNQRVYQVMEMAKYVSEKRALRVPTGQLNSLIMDATMMKQPPSDKGRRLKIYYVTQVAVKPPLFSFQINDRELMHFSYARYLENKIREGFGFEGTSLKFVFREKGEKVD